MGLMRAFTDALGFTAPQAMAYDGWSSSFEAGNYGTREMTDWHPSLLSADDEVLDTRDLLVARARDLYRNHPVIHGAVNKIADAVIGSRVMLDAKPMHQLLGRDIEWSLDWSLSTEAEFKVFAYSGTSCDVRGEATFGQLMRTTLITRIVDGECFLLLRNKARRARYTTCIEIIDSDRVTNPNGVPDGHLLANGNTIYGGIEYDRDGAPVAYHIRVKHPAQLNTQGDNFRWTRVARFTATGKQQIVHTYRQHRANQKRGVSALAPIVKRTRMNDKYDVAELEAALFDAINAGYVRSSYPTSDVAAAMAPTGGGASSGWSLEKQVAFRTKNKVSLEGTRMTHLFPGEEMQFKQPARPAGNYPPFKASGQQDMAAGIGLSYPQISEDWAGINYSSARTLLNEKWRGFESMGEEFTAQTCHPVYLAWLEEAVAIGTVKVPGGAGRFYDRRELIGYASWLRPGRGKVDPLKEENASDIAVHSGRSNNAIECANNGLDLFEVLQGRAREDRIRERLGLAAFVPLKLAGAAGSEAGGESAGTEADRDGDGEEREDEQQEERQSRRRQTEGAGQ